MSILLRSSRRSLFVSSSSISTFFVYGPTGPQGPQGNIGVDGNPGNTGNTGNTGPVGAYYISSRTTSDTTLELTLSDGTTFEVLGNFKGTTLADQTAGLVIGATVGNQYNFLREASGGTFYIRGLCAYGSLVASITGPNDEYISIDSIYFGNDILGNYDPTTLAPREMLYLGIPTKAYGANLRYSTDNGNAGLFGAFDFYQTDTTSMHLNAGSKILTIGPIGKGRLVGFTGNPTFSGIGTSQGIFLDCDAAGTFILKTPIGIAGISGSFKVNEVNSITVMIESDDVWRFPENVYFEPNENYLTCGKNILGLFTVDGGQSWIANVAHRGHGINNQNRQCIPGYLFGSCCYSNADGTKSCLDYTTRGICDSLFGEFNPATTCEASCGSVGSVCCSNGTCQENISVTLCESLGGSYWENASCNLGNPSGNNNERFCYDPCDSTQLVCCKNGQCLGNYTRIQCEDFLGGRSVVTNSGTCEGVDCCDYTTIDGACCVCTETSYECSQQSLTNCRQLSGTFMGPGKQCNEVSCGCVCGTDSGEDPTGACCGDSIPGQNPSCSITTESSCLSTNSYYQGDGTVCDPNPCPTISEGDGICCKWDGQEEKGYCGNETTEAQCTSACGNWLTEIPFNGEIYFINPDTDCVLCELSRPVVKGIDEGEGCDLSVIDPKNASFAFSSGCLHTLNYYDLVYDRTYVYIASSGTLREKIVEAFTCPYNDVALFNVKNNIALALQENGLGGGLLGCNVKCCQCSDGTLTCGPSAEYDIETCTWKCENTQLFPTTDNTGDTCGGLEQIGQPPGLPCGVFECLQQIPEINNTICCPIPLTFNTTRNIKVTINNEDTCIPIVCDYGCEDYELCE